MINPPQLSDAMEYQCQVNLNLYDSPTCERLATQAAVGRFLRITGSLTDPGALSVCLCEDNYPGWLRREDVTNLVPAPQTYHPPIISVTEIKQRLPNVIAFTQAAMVTPNVYLWGGTVAPNYDCSGLMQAAFQSVGIWLPRDAYQQEAFTQPINPEQLEPGDLVFFGTPQKATHVGLYLGDQRYIHSSGKDQGRNGIAIDILSSEGDRVSQTYYQQFRGAGRVTQSYCPQGTTPDQF